MRCNPAPYFYYSDAPAVYTSDCPSISYIKKTPRPLTTSPTKSLSSQHTV